MFKKIAALLLSIILIQPVSANLGGSNSDLGGTSQGSSQGSSDGSLDGSSAGTSDTNVTTTIVVIGAVILAVGIPLSIVSTTVKKQEENEQRLVYYMKNNHNELIHDLSLASGALLSQIAFELELTKSELMKIEKRLAGSSEQKNILKTLNGEIDIDDARIFSNNLSRIFLDVLGKVRINEVLKKAWGEK